MREGGRPGPLVQSEKCANREADRLPWNFSIVGLNIRIRGQSGVQIEMEGKTGELPAPRLTLMPHCPRGTGADNATGWLIPRPTL